MIAIPNREERGLHGPARWVRRVRAGPYPEQEEWEFDPEGRLVSRTWAASGGAQRRAQYFYDAQGREVEFREDGPGGTLLTRRQYDSAGRLSRIAGGSAEEPRLLAWRSYRADGSFTQRSPRPASGPPRGVLRVLPGFRQLYRMPGLAALRTEFSPAGRAFWSVFEPDDPANGYLVFGRHARACLLVEEFATAPGVIAPPPASADFRWPGGDQLARLSAAAEQRTSYEYDAAGREIFRRSESAGGLLWRVLRTEWNQAGDPASTSEDSAAGHRSKTVYAYAYDDYDNWTRKVARQERPGGEAGFVSDEERTITYY